MTITSPKFSLNTKDWLMGLLMAVGSPALDLLSNIAAGNFNINWTEQWHLAASAGAFYLIKNFFSGPPPPTSGPGPLGVASKKVAMLIGLMVLSSFSFGQSMFKPLPPTPKRPPHGLVFNRAIIGPTDSLPNIKDGHFQGFRFAGPDLAFAVPDFSIYTGLGIDYVLASADPVTGKWVYDFTVGPRVYGGANLGQPTVQAIGAVGIRFTAFRGWLAVGAIYNLTTKKPQATLGNPAALIPGLN